jgi:hypothetical protein
VPDVPDRTEPEPTRIASDLDRWHQSLPAAIEPYYPFTAPNEATLLYRGSLRTVLPNGEFLVEGLIELAWQPTPQIRYTSTENPPPGLFESLFVSDIDNDFYPAHVTAVPATPDRSQATDHKPTIEGRLMRLDIGEGQEFSFVIFQLANFLNYLGSWVRHGNKPDLGRLLMSAAGWRVTLDRRPDIQKTIDAVSQSGGYAITHVGRLEREDGSQFSRQQASELLDGLYWFCSFVNSSSCGPLLAVGFDKDGVATWSDWGVRSTERWHSPDGWADEHQPQEIASLFPGFLSHWLDPYWRRVVDIAVGFYLDANVPRTLERAVALAQIPLELLVHAVLVDGQHKAVNEVRTPSKGIARLLEHYQIPTVIPHQFKDLVDEASLEGWKSGPWAVTELRNEVVHVKRDTKVRSREVWKQAWKLIVWYVEMVLLATFGFQGDYGSRLKWPRWVGQVEPVPWAAGGRHQSADKA